MEGFNGPRTVISKDGSEHPLPDYVHWLEEQVKALQQDLDVAVREIVTLRRHRAYVGSDGMTW